MNRGGQTTEDRERSVPRAVPTMAIVQGQDEAGDQLAATGHLPGAPKCWPLPGSPTSHQGARLAMANLAPLAMVRDDPARAVDPNYEGHTKTCYAILVTCGQRSYSI
jgi:hypothetical protein